MNADIYNAFLHLNKCVATSDDGEKTKREINGRGSEMHLNVLSLLLITHLFPSISIDNHQHIVPTYFQTSTFLKQQNNILENAQILPKLLVHDNTLTLDTHTNKQIIKTMNLSIKCINSVSLCEI